MITDDSDFLKQRCRTSSSQLALAKRIGTKLIVPLTAIELFVASLGFGQNRISGDVHSGPYSGDARARIVARQLPNGIPVSTMTDATGNYLLFLPNGRFEILTKAENSYLDQDTVNVSGNLVRNRKEIASRDPESSYYISQLVVDKMLSGTRSEDPSHRTMIWPPGPIRVYNEGVVRPQDRANLDSVFNNLTQRTGGRLSFYYASTDSSVGVKNIFTHPIPGGGVGWTQVDDWYPDGSIKHATIWYNNNGPVVNQNVISRENIRAQNYITISVDPSYASYGPGSAEPYWHNDEVRTYMDITALPNYFDMSRLQDVDVGTLVNVSPSVALLNRPLEGDSVYSNNPVTFRWARGTDPDGDQVQSKLRVTGNGKDTTINAYLDSTATVAGSFFQPGNYTWSVTGTDGELSTPSVSRNLYVKNTSDVKELAEVPRSYILEQNFPNPFNPETNISFDLPKNTFVTLTVFNLLGQEVGTLVNGQLPAGTHNYVVGGEKFGLTSGVYFYRLSAGDFVQTRKMVLLR